MLQNKSKNENFSKLVVIVGPTASGKTGLAIQLAKKLNGEIICADSRTVYRGMDIGTAKPTVAEQQIVSHKLLDIAEPNEQLSVVQFKTLCDKAITDVRERGMVPFLVGGSGMYVDAVLFDYQFRAKNSDIDVRSMDYKQKLQKALVLYPKELGKIDVKNERRVDQLLMRGPSTDVDRKVLKKQCKIIGLMPNMLLLKQNIKERTGQMLNNGLVQETEEIIRKFHADCSGLNTIGYRQVVEYLNGSLAEDELENSINRATLGLAKRQMTWFKRNKAISWVASSEEAGYLVRKYLSK